MLDSLPITFLVATVFGFLAGIGIGGGTLLVLWLTLVIGMNQESARMINLMFFLPSALVSSFFRWRQGTLNIIKILPAIAAGCLTAWLFSYCRQYLSTDILQKIFGILLLATGLKELFYRSKN